MKKITICIAILAFVVACSAIGAFAAQSWELASPGGNIVAEITLSDEGSFTWLAKIDGREVLHESPVGIYTAYADFRNTLVYVSDSRAVINETYPMYSGKFSSHVNNANEITIRCSRVSGSNTRYINYIFRAYNDGVAVRYNIEGTGTTTNAHNTARTTFESTGLQLRSTDTINVTVYQQSYEPSAGYSQFSGFTGMTNNNGYNLPILVTTEAGDNLLFTQSDLDGRYVGVTAARPSDNNGLMQLRPSINQGTTAVNIALPFTSPWRVAVIGTLAAINETQLIENLATPNQIADPSWIESGITSWAWLTRASYPQSSKQTWLDLIDFAAEIGWKYVLMDDGWQPGAWSPGVPINTYYDWFDEVLEYAEEKGVGLLAWVHQSRLNTPEKRELLKEWAEKGIKGIKTDFFDSEAQSMMRVYDDITKAAADAKLIVNYHGSNLPNGERRTWPNVLSKEAVYGAEQSSTNATQDCILPFTRNAIGPMDFTPLQDPWFSASNYTTAHNTALAITVENGIQCLADFPNAYLVSPARDFFYKMPSKWDETKCIGAVLRQYYAVARRSGDTWYVGAVNSTARASQEIPLSFLGTGTFYAQIITEGASRSTINVELREVTASDVITVSMGTSGGAAMKITRSAPVSILEHTIGEANKVLQQNAANIARYISIRAAAETLRTEIAQKEALMSGTISLADLSAANNELWAAIDVFKQAVQGSAVIELKAPWVNKYPLPAKLSYNGAYSMTLVTDIGDFYDVSDSNRATKEPKNLHIMPLDNQINNGQIDVSVTVTMSPSGNYDTASILIYLDDAPAAGFQADTVFHAAMRRFHGGGSPNQAFFTQHRQGGGTATETRYTGRTASAPTFYLRVVKNPTGADDATSRATIVSYFRESLTEDWVEISRSTNRTALRDAAIIHVGVQASSGSAAGNKPAVFENFTVKQGDGIPEVIPFVDDFIAGVDDLEMEIALGTPPPLPSTVTAYYSNGTETKLPVVWESVGPELYNARGTFVVYGTVTGTNMYSSATVTTSRKATQSYLILADEDKDLNYIIYMATFDADGRLFEVLEKKGTVKAGESEEVSVEIDKLTGHTVQAFLWDQFSYAPLTLREDNTALKAAIAEAQSIRIDGYTRLSVDGFLNIIDEAIALTKNSSATQADFAAMIDKLSNAPLKTRYLSGVPFGLAGSWNDSGQTFHMVFDGDINTFFDHGTATAYAGIDLGAGNESIVRYIRYYPRIDDRQDIVNRLRGAAIKGGNTQPTSSATANSLGTALHTVPTTGNLNVQWYTVESSNATTAYRYLWIYNTNFYGNISELEFWPTNPDHSDVSLLEDRIAYADSLTATNYTPESWGAMQTALTTAKALTGTSAQLDIDNAAQALKAAIAQLVGV